MTGYTFSLSNHCVCSVQVWKQFGSWIVFIRQVSSWISSCTGTIFRFYYYSSLYFYVGIGSLLPSYQLYKYVILGHVPSDNLTHILQSQNIYVVLLFLAYFVVEIDLVSLNFALHPSWNMISITGLFFFFSFIFHNLVCIQD